MIRWNILSNNFSISKAIVLSGCHLWKERATYLTLWHCRLHAIFYRTIQHQLLKTSERFLLCMKTILWQNLYWYIQSSWKDKMGAVIFGAAKTRGFLVSQLMYPSYILKVKEILAWCYNLQEGNFWYIIICSKSIQGGLNKLIFTNFTMIWPYFLFKKWFDTEGSWLPRKKKTSQISYHWSSSI